LTDSCDACLRRAHLLGRLSARISGLLDHPRRRAAGLLALSDDDLIAAVAADQIDSLRGFVEDFDPAAARHRLVETDIEAVCRHSEGYPAGLRDLTDPPAALFVRGGRLRLSDLARQPLVTIVGTRQASPYGIEVARELGRSLAVAGVPVISGLALGIDGAAHRGVLDADGAGIAVLACGADVIYPRTHRALYERLLERGVVVSELPPGQRALKWSFPARNRIMAALAATTIVVEAADGSGTLITAAFATDLHRDVGAIPGRVTARMAAGSNRLLRDGAHVVRGVEDVLDLVYGVGVRPASGTVGCEEEDRAGPRSEGLEPGLRQVLDAIEAGQGVETLVEAALASAREVRVALGRLEALGLVTRDGFGSYERTAVECAAR
jgi:DNA processing protein